jgi:hypothetical protein
MSLRFGAFGKSLARPAMEAIAQALDQTPELADAVRAAREAEFNAYPNLAIDTVVAAPGVVDAVITAFDRHLRPTVA